MRSYAKINIFLKIIGIRGNYHEIISRFVLFDGIFDELNFIKKQNGNEKIEIICNKEIPHKNTITMVIDELFMLGFKNQLLEFFKNNSLKIEKNIPLGGGLGGASSNASTFLKMINEELNLKLTKEKMLEISRKIGADVSFFTSDTKSANVSGIGEIIEEFDDEIPNLELVLKNIFCSTPIVFNEFRNNFLNEINMDFSLKLKNLKSAEILDNFKNYELNDLLKPCLKTHPNLEILDDEFLSGSGSSCFKKGIL